MSCEQNGGGPLLYCHCAYAKVVPEGTKHGVLARLGASTRDFEAVPDLCEMAAKKDPRLAELAGIEDLTIVACFPRAVRWLFHSAGSKLAEGTRIENMREGTPEELCSGLGLSGSEDPVGAADSGGATR